MTDLYREMQAVASDVLQEFKQGTIQYIAVAPGNGPGDNPGPATETPHTLNAVAKGVSFRYRDNVTIVASDLQITMPGDGVAPAMNGFIEMDGTRYKIVGIRQKPAAGVPVAWVVIFRK